MTWSKLEPLPAQSKGCLNCGAVHESLRISAPLAVGFGFVSVTRDGERVWEGDDEHVWLRRFERRAAADPDHDWRVYFNAPLWEATYQRQGEKHWVLVEKGMGFA
jgi:hypothetical protein